mgnify:CR=1 FL=1
MTLDTTDGRDGGDDRDARLLSSSARGDQRAYAHLFATYRKPLARFALRFVGRADLAEDVASEALNVAWRRAGTFEGRSKVSSWLFGIAYRLALKARRVEGREVQDDAAIAKQHDPIDGRAALDAAFLKRDLQRALDRLSPEHRAVIRLTFIDGLSYSEIAERLSCPEGTVKTRVMHARANLRRLMAEGVSRRNGDQT